MGVYCLDMFMMLVSTDVAFRGRIPVALSFGLVILCARTGTLIGSFAADQLQHAELWSEALRSEVFLVGVLALVLVGMLFFTQTDVQKLYATSPAEAVDASLEQKCAAIARMCRLTNREAEVLALLARGRTVRYICDELSIAQGTAKHHVSSICRKVGVFDRQGLLDTIEQGGVGNRDGSDGRTLGRLGSIAEERVGAAARAFGAIQSPVGVSVQLLVGGTVLRIQSDAQADGDRPVIRLAAGRLAHRRAHALRDRLHERPRRNAPQTHHELVAAHTSHQVAVANGTRHASHRLDDHAIAGHVAVPVVRHLEAIEVGHDQRMTATGLGPLDEPRAFVFERRAVQHARKRISLGAHFLLPFALELFGGVAERDNSVHQAAFAVEHQRVIDLKPAKTPRIEVFHAQRGRPARLPRLHLYTDPGADPRARAPLRLRR